MSNKERQARFRAKKLEQECPEVRDILDGHMPKRDLYERMQAFIKGIEEVKK